MAIDPSRYRPEPIYTAGETAQRAGIDEAFAHRLFRALGLPQFADDELEFDDRDVGVLRSLKGFLDDGYAPDDIVTVARTYGYSLSRVALAEVRLFRKMFVDPLERAGKDQPEIERRMDKVIPTLLEVLDDQIGSIHRRHLRVALSQVTATTSDGATETLAAGFVDLVGFSRLSNDLEGDDLEDLVSRFETLAIERCVDSGAQIVKVIGDAVMFVSSDPSAAVAAAVAVVSGAANDPDLPEARAGLDLGAVRPLGGDYFGRPINVAARLTNFARPGTVVVSSDLVDALPDEPENSHIGRIRLKGVGTVRAFKITF